MFRNKFLYLFIGISLFVAGYLYYVKKEREQSIELYFSQPKLGDIYKIKSEDEEGTSFVHYWKVTQVSDKGLAFAAGKYKAWASVDYLQKHFDELQPFADSQEELIALKKGNYNNGAFNNATLIEIVRKE